MLAYTHTEKLDAKHIMHDPLRLEPAPDERCEADGRCGAGKNARRVGRARAGLDSCSTTWHRLFFLPSRTFMLVSHNLSAVESGFGTPISRDGHTDCRCSTRAVLCASRSGPAEISTTLLQLRLTSAMAQQGVSTRAHQGSLTLHEGLATREARG